MAIATASGYYKTQEAQKITPEEVVAVAVMWHITIELIYSVCSGEPGNSYDSEMSFIIHFIK